MSRRLAVATVASTLALALLPAVSVAAPAKEKTLGRVTLDGDDDGAAPIDLQLVRLFGADGSLTLKLVARGLGPKAQTLVIYQGGGDEDGAGEEHFRGAALKAFDVGGGARGARVDFTYQHPEAKKRDEITDTTIVGFAGGKPKKLFELRTRRGRDKNKLCKEAEETRLAVEGNGEGRVLVATTVQTVDPVLGDDDLPVDKSCRAPKGAQKKSYKWADGRFVDPDATDEEGDD
jgi:hypothetical protein